MTSEVVRQFPPCAILIEGCGQRESSGSSKVQKTELVELSTADIEAHCVRE